MIISINKNSTVKLVGMMRKKPRILISSTIYDFRDLRSSLKYWLEEYGFDVKLSEFNDFEKGFDKNSYDACLKAIHNCDYFILLLGSRTGGYYNIREKISITRKEYQEAYLQKKFFVYNGSDILLWLNLVLPQT